MTELYTYIETLNPEVMVEFMQKVETAYSEAYWNEINSMNIYSFGKPVGNITLSNKEVAGKVTGITLFHQLTSIPGFYDLLRGTTSASDLMSENITSEKETEEE